MCSRARDNENSIRPSIQPTPRTARLSLPGECSVLAARAKLPEPTGKCRGRKLSQMNYPSPTNNKKPAATPAFFIQRPACNGGTRMAHLRTRCPGALVLACFLVFVPRPGLAQRESISPQAIQVCPLVRPIPAAGSSLSGTVGAPFTLDFVGTSDGVEGGGPYTFTSSGALPPGLSFSSSGGMGHLSGTPSEAGAFMFTVTADAAGCSGSSNFTVSIVCPPSAVSLAPTSLPNAALGVFYSQTITASGSSTHYQFRYPNGVPPGLSPIETDTTVTLSGTPTAVGVYPFLIVATDPHGCTGSATLPIRVTATAQPDLQVSADDGGASWGESETFLYTISYANVGTATATNVKVTAQLDPAADGTSGAWSCRISFPRALVQVHDHCELSIGALAPGERQTVQLEVTVSADLVRFLVGEDFIALYHVFSQFEISEAESDGNPDDNRATTLTPNCRTGPIPILCGLICPLQLLACTSGDVNCPVPANETPLLRPQKTSVERSPQGPSAFAIRHRTEVEGSPSASEPTRPTQERGSSRQVSEASPWQWIDTLARKVIRAVRDLRVYYEVRNQILAGTALGRRYIALYYDHSAEISQLLLDNASLRELGGNAMDAWEPSLRALVDGAGDTVTFTQAMADTLTALLEALKQNGSAGLRADIEREQRTLDFRAWVGLTMDEALRRFRNSGRSAITVPFPPSR